ncbi:MAG: hypothetical protein QUS09_08060 [Methanotrichaceae archaeon]|nr:hypothetical protein [Methanotrichaceae archaeon]
MIQKIYDRCVRHVFGVPGDYVLGFFNKLAKSRPNVINTCDEQGGRLMQRSFQCSSSAELPADRSG